MRAAALLALLACARAAAADEPSPAHDVSQEEIEKALKADEAAKKQAQPAPPAGQSGAAPSGAAQAIAPGAAAASAPSVGGAAWGAVSRFVQSLNPDLSAIVDLAGGWYSNDDAIVKSAEDPAHTGFNAQEIEIALSAVVDPYFRADLYLTIANLEGIEVEEGILTTTNLPWNLQLRAGVIRAAFGRQNTQHLHTQDFTRRPLANALFLGPDGLRAPGLEVNWLVPRLPFYLVLTAEAFSVGGAEPDQPLATFGGGQRWDFTYVGNARASFDLDEATTLLAGLSYASGKTSQLASRDVPLPTGQTALGLPVATAYDDARSHLFGADLYLKWKPPNQTKSWASVTWQTEYFLRWLPEVILSGAPRSQLEGGLYTQVVVQLHRRWYLGLRGEVLGAPAGDNVPTDYGAAASLTWALSEFSRVRLYGDVHFPQAPGLAVNGSAFVQLEASIGPHGAHPF